MSLPIIISIFFYLSFTFYLFYGMYILSYEKKILIHKLYAWCCFSVAIWAFSFSIANSAADYETCLLFRKIATLGWGSFFSLFLHFILVLTNKENLLKKKWIYVFLYLPVLFNIVLFGVVQETANSNYNLEFTNSGWVNVSTFTIWNTIYNIYYLCFAIYGIICVLQWGYQSKEKSKRREGYIIGFAYLIAFLLGTVSDLLMSSVLHYLVPQMGPLVIFIPLSIVFLLIKRYGVIHIAHSKTFTSYSDILNEQSRYYLYRLITAAYYFAGIVNFGTQYFSKRESLGTALIFSIVIFMLGFLIGSLQRMRENYSERDFFSEIIMVITIPVMIFNYFEYTTIYVLIVPFIFLLVGITFNHKRMLILTSVFTIIPLVTIWLTQPYQIVVMTSMDHAIRIGTFAVLFLFALYINHIYRKRLLENEEQLKMQSFLSQITNLFLMADESNIDKKMDQMLTMCSQRFDMDRIYIIIFSKSRHEKNKVYEWYNEGFEPIRQILEDTFVRDLPIWIDIEKLKRQKYISIPEVSQMKPGQAKEWLENRNIISFIINAMVNKDQVIGLIGGETIHESATFQKSPTEFLSLLTNMISNVWNKIESEKENNYRANYDTLTSLANRSSLIRKVEEEIEYAGEKGNKIGIIFVDVDSFKAINDTLGHSGGDELLIQIGQRLKKLVRYYDTVSRFGGDEFVIMIPDMTKNDDINKIADKILVGFNRPFHINNQSFYITVSLGISIYPTDGETSQELIRYSDMAMYQSKINGKNKYTICSDDMRKQVLLQTELTNDLHHALEHREFVLNYQPQINAKDGTILGFEALIRWKHPTRGFISPGVFIPLAERTGLINNIGEWVLYEACRQNKAWEAMGYPNLVVAVNLSLAQFLNPNLVNTVRATLIQTKLKPQFLELEITESIAAYDKDSIIKTMNKLKELGVSLSIDDFGVEYSSLSRLDQMPIDRIKIDMKFVHGITSGNKDEGIIQVILQMGRIFGLRVIAEGVENEAQLDFLKTNNCDEIQGFYFYKPMPAEDITNLLEGNGRII